MIYAIIAAVLLVAGFATGWQTHGWKSDAEKVAAIEAAEAARAAEERRANEISNRFEKRLANLRIVNRTINNEVRRETETRVYTDCVVPDSGRGLLNRAIDAANGNAAQSDAALRPAAPAPGGSTGHDGRSAGVGDSGSSGLRRLFGAAGGGSGGGQ